MVFLLIDFMNFFRSTIIISSLTALSRLTGYFRDMLMSYFIGIGAMGDALSLAIKLPAFFRRIFAEGAFHVSFLPLYTKSNKNKEFAGMTLSFLMSSLGFMTLGILFYFKPLMSCFYVVKNTQVKEFFFIYGPILFPYAFFISVTSFFGSLLNAAGHFWALAFSHALSNIFVVLYVIFAMILKKYGFFSEINYGFFFATGILFSGICQLLFVFIAFWKTGGRIKFYFPRKTPWMISLVKNFLSGLFSVGILQLNTLITANFALRLPVGSVSLFHYADRLNQLPLSIVGVSLSSALLPALSAYVANNDKENMTKAQNQSLVLGLFLTLPCVAFFLNFSPSIVSFVYCISRFSPEQSVNIAQILMIYSFGIPGYVMMKILNTRFFAQGKNNIPFIVSIVGVITDLTACIFLYKPFAHLGLAMASTLSAWSMVSVLLSILIIKEKWSPKDLLNDFFSLGIIFITLLGFWFLCHKTMYLWGSSLIMKGLSLGLYGFLGLCILTIMGRYFNLISSLGTIFSFKKKL